MDQVSVKTNDDQHYWCAEDGGGLEGQIVNGRPAGLAVANRNEIGGWEQFTVRRHSITGRVGFRSEKGSWLSAQRDSNVLVFNRRRSDDWEPEAWESFEVVPGIEHETYGGVAFRTDHGTFVHAPNNGGSTLVHVAVDAPGADQTFYPSVRLLGGGVGGPRPGQAIGWVEPAGLMRMQGWAFADDAGPRPFLIVTLMDGETLWVQDRPRLDRNLAYVLANGGDAVRTLSEVDWPGPEENPRLVEQTVEFVRHAWQNFRIRTALTVFGSHSHIPATERSQWMDMLCRGLRDANLAEALFYIEPQNEPGGPRLRPAQLAEEAWIARGYFPHVPIALGAPYSDTASTTTGWEENEAGAAAYRRFCREPATFCTPHLDRGINGTEGEYRICRQPWLAMMMDYPYGNNEPSGPDASAQAPGVMQDRNMQRVAANGAWMQRAAFHCWHTDAGVGMRSSKLLEQEPGLEQLSAIREILPRDIANWRAKNWHWTDNPFKLVGDVRASGGRGPVRTHGLVNGGGVGLHIIGNDFGCEVDTRSRMRITRFSWDGTRYSPQQELQLGAGQRFHAPEAPDQVYFGQFV